MLARAAGLTSIKHNFQQLVTNSNLIRVPLGGPGIVAKPPNLEGTWLKQLKFQDSDEN